jgi:hypothetical protein
MNQTAAALEYDDVELPPNTTANVVVDSRGYAFPANELSIQDKMARNNVAGIPGLLVDAPTPQVHPALTESCFCEAPEDFVALGKKWGIGNIPKTTVESAQKLFRSRVRQLIAAGKMPDNPPNEDVVGLPSKKTRKADAE